VEWIARKDQEMITKHRGVLVLPRRFVLSWAIPEFVPVIRLLDELKVRTLVRSVGSTA
jgi:hypothetical protein